MDCVRLQSMLQRMDNNMERLRVAPTNQVHDYMCGPFKGDPPLLWPCHSGEPVPAMLDGEERPDSLYALKRAPAPVINAMLRHYELPHGSAGGTLDNRRRDLLRHIGVTKF